MAKDEATWLRYLVASVFGLLALGVFCLQAWLIMLLFGWVHSWAAVVPAISFAWACILTVAFNIFTSVGYLVRSPKRN